MWLVFIHLNAEIVDSSRKVSSYSSRHLTLELLLALAFIEDQTVADSEGFIGAYVVEIEITPITKPQDFPLIRTKESGVINYENKCKRLAVDQIKWKIWLNSKVSHVISFREHTG